MTFPTVESSATTNAPFASSHVITMPSGIVAGDLLLLFGNVRGSSTLVFPAGWNRIANPGAGGNSSTDVQWKKAVGSDTLTVSVTVNNDSGNYNVYRIGFAEDPDTQAPEASEAVSSNSPNLTPTGGAKDYLWFTSLGSLNGANGSPPTNYANELSSRGGGNGMESARRALNASSENPGGWGTPGTQPTSTTIAVHPISLPTVVLTGTVVPTDAEADIRAGNRTIIMTVGNGTWATSGANFDAERQGIISGLVSAGSETGGFNVQVRPRIPVGNVVRDSDTIVTITIPAVATYQIENEETITATIPTSAIVGASDPTVATPTFDLINSTESGFPIVEGRTFSGQPATGTSVTVDLPSGIQAGELLLVYVGSDGPQTDIAFPGDWTRINFTEHTNSDGAQASAFRVADGTEGATITVTLNSSKPTTHVSYRISNFRSPTVQLPEVATNESGIETTTPDPPNLVPTGGIKDYLWFAFGTEFSGNDFTAGPSSYSNFQEAAAGTSSAAGAERQLFAASENPGTFTLIAGADWQTMTMAIHPAFFAFAEGAAGGGPGTFQKETFLL